MVIAPWIIYAALALAAASAIYTYYTMRKSQKRNRAEPTQLDGSISDEGVSFSDIAGSPHIYGNIVWKGDESTTPIKSEGGKK
ncbi:MAG: hypothetical protein RR231_12515 [Acinetobacter sp.]